MYGKSGILGASLSDKLEQKQTLHKQLGCNLVVLQRLTVVTFKCSLLRYKGLEDDLVQ